MGILVAWIGTVSACATVPQGRVGVLLTPSGVAATPLGEGVHAVNPLSQVELYDLRVDEHNEDLAAISADGATLVARASILTFHAAPGEVVALAREVGPHYYAAVVLPFVSSTVRMVLAGVRADQLDTPGILRAQAEVTRVAAQRLRRFHIIVDSINLRTLGLLFTSAAYAAVVDTGIEEQHVFLARQRIMLARQRADNRREEAHGISGAHAVVAPGLTPAILENGATRAWATLLASPSTAVEVRASDGPTITEIEP
jgi:regulator of protease activity HflC (stomatin/prohibitin superfamily)